MLLSSQGAKCVSVGMAGLCHLQSWPRDLSSSFWCQGRAVPAEQNLCSELRPWQCLSVLGACPNQHSTAPTSAPTSAPCEGKGIWEEWGSSLFFPNICDWKECLPSKACFLLAKGGLLQPGEEPPACPAPAPLQGNVPEEGRLQQGHCWDVTPGEGDSHQGQHGASCV